MKKGIIITLSLLALLLVSAIALPYIFKDKIVALVKDESNKNVNATIEFSDVDLTLFNSFPKLTVIINDLSIVNKEPFVNDTLLSTKEFGITLGLLSVIKGEQMDIYGIYLDKPRIQLMINESGIANWDIALTDSSEADSDTSASSFKMSLQKYSISDAYLLYDDKSLGFKTELKDFNHSGKGNFTQDNFVLQTETKCQALNLWYENVKYLSEVNTNITADIDMNIPNFTFTFKENKILLNELAFGVDGFVSMPNDDIDMDLKFDVKQNEFKHFLSLIPGMYSDNFKDLKSSGALSFSGFLRGTYNDTQMPGFQVALNIKDGMFQYPSLPSAVNNVQVDLLVDNPDGNTDHTIINLKKFHAELGK
ncbi:MAG TPA: AsmA family protein, partial [Bacteroidia bacterium]|nr:AsmA family protein [Bacteroidia bacterium]